MKVVVTGLYKINESKQETCTAGLTSFSAHSSTSTLPATATSREWKVFFNLGKMKDPPPSFAKEENNKICGHSSSTLPLRERVNDE